MKTNDITKEMWERRSIQFNVRVRPTLMDKISDFCIDNQFSQADVFEVAMEQYLEKHNG